MDRQLFLRRRWAIIAFLGLSACVRYRPMPINPEAIHAQLQPPDMADLCILAREIKHPLLHPLEMKPYQGLSPDEAAVLAVIANPSLRAARDRRALADAQLLQAGLLPNPQLSASLEPVTGGATAGTFTGYGYGMSWDVSAVIARRAKTDSARADRDSVDLEVAWQEWQVAQAARLSVYRLLSLRERVSLARDMKNRFAANLRQVRQAVQEGLMTELDLSAAETTGNQAQADLADLLKQVREQHLELNQMLGFPPQTPVALRQGVVLPSRLDLPPEQDIVADLEERRLDLMALRKGYESQEAALRVAILEQFPKINLNLNRARDTSNVITLPLAVSVDLPILDRNQAVIAREGATRQQMYDEYVNRVFEARSEIAMLIANAGGIEEQLHIAEESVPGFQRLVNGYRQATGQGLADVLSYYTAWNNLFARQMEIVTLKQQLLETRIALEITAGVYQLGSLRHTHAPTENTPHTARQ